ncbi:MAG: hypothetical protein A3C15_03780 [Candidatus Magasanikbacteria bacterium RIFCSPHIGHO2_02_FULL_50_9b]|uniref:Uncharacterized protein n=1 Tax=Candidatus Magasanikbacteria bacterium RIFCSPHIGHO2_02_FULL_50_9b TaxID=1798682 RepID=A0A1F6M960_9BACT|nr:MAG: hypothetical protein A3C15_03780 [Candidatus Magasanikbacteria bacterium RIFCSPHIGHO2_02_FULL_50_9b]
MEQQEFEPAAKLDTGQRIGVGLLIAISVLLVVVSVVQFRANIFGYGRRIKSNDLASVDPATRAKNELEALKKTDTDTDGLSDYDELTVYHSSPYMRDTDSDGAFDGDEVRRGTSPTCPEGKDCLLNTVAADAQTSLTATSTSSVAPLGTTSQAQVNTQNQQNQQMMTIVQIREALIANGVPKDQIDAMSDADLLKLVAEAQKEQESGGQTEQKPE